ncbi:hypothetical protein LSH36_324g02006, partial [Paralvinella palmiformis]
RAKMAALFVKGDSCKVWEKTGKSEFLKLCKSLISSPDCFFTTEELSLKRIVYELLWHYLRGLLKVEQIVAVLTELADMHPEIPSLLADIFGILGFISILQMSSNFNRAARAVIMRVVFFTETKVDY